MDQVHRYIQDAHANRVSAGLLMYRRCETGLEVFLVHPGGPYFQNKDEGFWGVPKGLLKEEEDELGAAIREFEEETGIRPEGKYLPLGEVVQRSGKRVHAWAFAGDWDPADGIESNEILVEWPPRSGQQIRVPEVDEAAFYPVAVAREKISKRQIPFIDRLEEHVGL